MKKLWLFPLFLLAETILFAGMKLYNPTNVPHSITLPATCSQGDMYQDVDATSGSQWYLCESTNTWSVEGGGSATVIMNQASWQQNAQFSVSSGSVSGQFIVRSATSTGFGSVSNSLQIKPKSNQFDPTPDLLYTGGTFDFQCSDGFTHSTLEISPTLFQFTTTDETNPGFIHYDGFTTVNSSGSTTQTGGNASLGAYETKSMPISRDILKVAIDNEDFTESSLFHVTRTTITASEPFEVTIATLSINGVQYNWPASDGTNGQVLSTNGNRQLSFATAGAGSPIYAIIENRANTTVSGYSTAQIPCVTENASSGMTADTTNGRITVSTGNAGTYVICENAYLTGNIGLNTSVYIVIRKNNVAWRSFNQNINQTSDFENSPFCAIDGSNSDNDYYELWVTNNTGSNLTIGSSSSPYDYATQLYGWKLK